MDREPNLSPSTPSREKHTANPKWIACHDALVCFGESKVQKWCVRVGDKKGPLVAVMLTKEVAHALAAAPDLIAALKELDLLIDFSEPASDDKPMTFEDWSGLNAAFEMARAALAKAESRS